MPRRVASLPLSVEAARQEIGALRLGRQRAIEHLRRLGHQELGIRGIDNEPAQLLWEGLDRVDVGYEPIDEHRLRHAVFARMRGIGDEVPAFEALLQRRWMAHRGNRAQRRKSDDQGEAPEAASAGALARPGIELSPEPSLRPNRNFEVKGGRRGHGVRFTTFRTPPLRRPWHVACLLERVKNPRGRANDLAAR